MNKDIKIAILQEVCKMIRGMLGPGIEKDSHDVEKFTYDLSARIEEIHTADITRSFKDRKVDWITEQLCNIKILKGWSINDTALIFIDEDGNIDWNEIIKKLES